MKKFSFLAIVAIAAIMISSCTTGTPKANLKNDVDTMSYAIGMAQTQGLKDYLVMQHDLNKPVSEQVYDVYSVQETLGMKVPFDDMVQKIKDDIIQSIQMGR